tara:strand:- start:229 stop:414 length:186 start_codon:yes stop_codon:yes gene_type:complete
LYAQDLTGSWRTKKHRKTVIYGRAKYHHDLNKPDVIECAKRFFDVEDKRSIHLKRVMPLSG